MKKEIEIVETNEVTEAMTEAVESKGFFKRIAKASDTPVGKAVMLIIGGLAVGAAGYGIGVKVGMDKIQLPVEEMADNIVEAVDF